MKLIKSGWLLAIIAAFLNLGITGGVIVAEFGAILHPNGVAARDAIPKFWSFRATDVDTLVADLNDQKGKLIARQTELEKLAAHIESERQELEKTRSDIDAMRDQINAQIPQIQDSEKKNIKTLATTYSDISPTAAVAILREMDETICAKLLSQMKPDKVAAILQEMSAEDKDETMTKRAARISDKLRLMQANPQPHT
jgi:flagellar motility protein MotE (MotC chaperone)